ncbi:hypothetical protein GCM10010340_49980 [Streptomyces griseoloalbus]|nr:hypothetical protein GCM10010340_49980 [Streptomyces albaduncus]
MVDRDRARADLVHKRWDELVGADQMAQAQHQPEGAGCGDEPSHRRLVVAVRGQRRDPRGLVALAVSSTRPL